MQQHSCAWYATTRPCMAIALVHGVGEYSSLSGKLSIVICVFLQILFDNAESVCYHLDKVAEHFFDELRFCFGVYGIGL